MTVCVHTPVCAHRRVYTLWKTDFPLEIWGQCLKPISLNIQVGLSVEGKIFSDLNCEYAIRFETLCLLNDKQKMSADLTPLLLKLGFDG